MEQLKLRAENMSQSISEWWQLSSTALADALAAVREGQAQSGDYILVGAAAAVLLLVMLVLFRSLLRWPSEATFQPSSKLSDRTRGPKWFGYAVALLFFGGFGGWAAYAPLSAAALANGVVNPDGRRKTVQHLEGGIIQSIHVREGQQVAAGDVLVTLDTLRARARLEEIRERMVHLLASRARLEAELVRATEVTFPLDEIYELSENPELTIATQRQLFSDRQKTQDSRERILSKRIDQLRSEIGGLQEVITAQAEQIDYLQEEIDVSASLYEKGLNRLPELLVLKRAKADLLAQRALNRATIARLEQQIGETELQLVATRQQGAESFSTEIADIRSELATLRSVQQERLDALKRTVVLAPISGRVLNLRVTTEQGGVLASGGEILDIVPDESRLLIDARVRPSDIDTVYPGMKARVILTAFAQRNLPRLYGTVDLVAADRQLDERTGEPYFLVKVAVLEEDIAALGHDIELTSGMPADVMLLTGERTLADYLLRPFVDSLRQSFRES